MFARQNPVRRPRLKAAVLLLATCTICVAGATPTVTITGNPSPNAHVAIDDEYSITVQQIASPGYQTLFNSLYIADGDTNGPSQPVVWTHIGTEQCGGGSPCQKSWTLIPLTNGTRWHKGTGTDNSYFWAGGNYAETSAFGWFQTP